MERQTAERREGTAGGRGVVGGIHLRVHPWSRKPAEGLPLHRGLLHSKLLQRRQLRWYLHRHQRSGRMACGVGTVRIAHSSQSQSTHWHG